MFRFAKKSFLIFVVFSFLFSGFIFSEKAEAQEGGFWANVGGVVTWVIGDENTNTVVNGLANASPSSIANAAGDKILEGLQSKITQAVTNFLEKVIVWTFSLIAEMVSFIGDMLDQAIQLTVVNFKGTYDSLSESINLAWAFLRDLANIVFIFLILWTAIQIIINGDLFGKKKTLGMIIVVAITLNFSMFFVKAAVDLSNYATIAVYNSIKVDGRSLGEDNDEGKKEGIGLQVFSRLGLPTFANPATDGAKAITSGITGSKDPTKLIQMMIFFAIMNFVVAFIFIYTTVMIIWRFFAIILLIISSPIAIMSTIIPSGKKFWDAWLKELTTNLMFAPVFFLLFNMVLIFADRSHETLAKGGSFSNLGEYGASNLGMLINFSLILLFMFIAVYASRKISVHGSGFSAGVITSSSKYMEGRMRGVVGRSTAGVAGATSRATVGRAASRLENSAALKRLSSVGFGVGAAANKIRSGAKKAATSSFDARSNKTLSSILGPENEKNKGGYRGVIDRKTKEREETAKWVASATDKEQRVIDAQKISDTAHSKAIKDQKDTEKKIKDYEKELQGIREDIVDNVFDDNKKEEYKKTSRVIKSLEKQQSKGGTLAPKEQVRLSAMKNKRDDLNKEIDRSADNQQKTRIEYIKSDETKQRGKLIELKDKTVAAKNESVKLSDSTKEVKERSKTRIIAFEDKLEKGGMIRQSIDKRFRSKNGGKINNSPHWALQKFGNITGRKADKQAYLNRRTGGGEKDKK